VSFASLQEVDVLVTDARATQDQLDPVIEAGVKVVVA